MSTETLVKCAKCDHAVRLLDPPPRTRAEIGTAKVGKGLQCKHCGKYWCLGCRDVDRPCTCGQKLWKKAYFLEQAKPHWWSRFFQR